MEYEFRIKIYCIKKILSHYVICSSYKLEREFSSMCTSCLDSCLGQALSYSVSRSQRVQWITIIWSRQAAHLFFTGCKENLVIWSQFWFCIHPKTFWIAMAKGKESMWGKEMYNKPRTMKKARDISTHPLLSDACSRSIFPGSMAYNTNQMTLQDLQEMETKWQPVWLSKLRSTH